MSTEKSVMPSSEPTSKTSARQDQRGGDATKKHILEVSLRLFTEKGFEGTSVRDITRELGMTQSSLYYHFKNKDQIAISLLSGRQQEIEELAQWIQEQPQAPDLAQRAALRWLNNVSPEQLLGMRFAQANRPLIARLAPDGETVRTSAGRLAELLVPAGASSEDKLYARLAFNALIAALFAAEGTDASDQDIIAVAKRGAVALTAPQAEKATQAETAPQAETAQAAN